MEYYSTDRHVDSDTRFRRGMWELKQGVTIRWATEIFNTETQDNNSLIYTVEATRPLRSRGDTCNAPSISTKITSPAEGVAGIESYHYLASYLNAKEARFEIKTDAKASATALVDKDVSMIKAGGEIAAKVAHNPFGIDFVGENDTLLTKLGSKSLGYVQDSRFPRDGVTGNKDSPYFTAQLHLSVGEKLFGLGERFGPFVKNGQRVEVWNEDDGTASEWTYKNIPFYLSSYGIFVDSASDVIFEIQSERTTRVNITVPGEGIRFYVIYGPGPKKILYRYAKLTGFPALPPA